MTPAQLQTLRTELTADPLSRNYSSMSDEAAADSLNAPTRQADRESLDAGLLAASFVRSEYNTLAANDKQYLAAVLATGSLPLTDNLKTQLGALFPAGSTTRANLLALLKRTGSRAEELGLPRVTPSDAADARRNLQ